MKRIMAVVMAFLFLLGVAATADARGRGGGGHGGGFHGGHGGGFHGGRFHGHHFRGHGFRSTVVIGGGLWLGPYWYPPYYYPYYPYDYYEPAPVVAEPQTYVQQSPSYWYYCESAKAYYPYVQSCPGGWLTVVPQAAPESQR